MCDTNAITYSKYIKIFDFDYCLKMKDHLQYSKLMKKPYDEYRNMDLVWKSSYCKQNHFNESNTLLIDQEHEVVQLCLNNSIVPDPFDLAELLELAKDPVNGNEFKK